MPDLEEAKGEIAKASSDEDRLRLLLEKSIQLYRNHPKEAHAWATEAIKLARKRKNKVEEARAFLRMGCASFQLSEYTRTIQEAGKAIEILDKAEPTSGTKASAILLSGMALSKIGQHREALKNFRQALELTEDGSSRRVEVLIETGNTFLALADYPNALEQFYSAIAILDLKDDPLRRSVLFSNIGRIYLTIHDLEKAQAFFERASLLAKNVRDEDAWESALYHLALIANEQEDVSRAKDLFSQSLTLAERLQKRDSEAYVECALGEIALNAKDDKRAFRHFQKAIKINEALHIASIDIIAHIGLGKLYINIREPKKALTPLQIAFAMSRDSGMRQEECDAANALAKGYEETGDLKKAVHYFNLHLALSEELHNKKSERAIIEIFSRVEIEKADRERARLEELAADANKRAEILRAETERQSNELTQLALQLVQKNEFLCNLKEEIEPVIKSSKKAKEIAEQIDAHIKSDRDWETFEHQFNQVHREFFSKIASEYPALTPMELKIAVMIKLNLPTKAIANLFCLSSRTVENHRQSIRRKLRLGTTANLVSFLTRFGEGQ